MMTKKIWLIACALGLAFAGAAAAADYEFQGEVEPEDAVSSLLAYYVKEFSPAEFDLIIDNQPDATGRIRDLYMDLTGVEIDNFRLDKLIFRINDVQFNPPENWENNNVECISALQVYAYARLLESDINNSIEAKTFGDDGDHWQKISLKITPKGLKGMGYYMAEAFFGRLGIRIDIDSGLKIVANKELWLNNPKVKINKVGLPDYLTNKALSQIQPLLDLRKFPLPLSLSKISLEDKKAVLSTRLLPQPIEHGISYHYAR